MIRGDDGVTRAAIDWDWFKEYRDILVAGVAAGKKVVPEIYQRYLNPAEKLLTLAQNTYGRKAGGRRASMAESSAWPSHRTPPQHGEGEYRGSMVAHPKELISRILCKFRRTSRNRRYAPAGHLLRGVWPSTMYNDHAL
jgi:hypothetical protein